MAPVAGPSKERPHKKSRHHPYTSKSPRPIREDALPGVQKLKSVLRQTKRLLANDNLAADVRVETERRLKALEVDLARAEQSRKERHFATRYHKVKFFERQKVVRKIKQIKRSMAASEAKEEQEKLKSALADMRVDLNYVLYFPKTKKYVSLFPPEVRMSGSAAAPVAASLDDNEERSRVREMIRQQMARGELSAEPENELGKPGRENKQSVSSRRGADVAPSVKARTYTDDVATDNFFGDDDDDEEVDEDSSQSEASDS
ncbi:hypothetical protein L210DRAFT_3409515 [Boletus edulis BED1]|uniref:rRNA-processing protein EFG1 n=1 Tax=Boletus edulis BED1 TaxID=1328754 RepID=A0AAD4GBW5_BOLED|nr:hypothetical protein L210DRAFT_3409515 [Boletus edulis BED1]